VTVALIEGPVNILVDTAGGRYCITGDAVMWYENLEKMIPPGINTSMIDCMASLARISREADHVLPAHEPKVFACQPARFP
jgi:glyoxylase-like metal-dependent hydrolase (beta-lactamase superfamily II)